MPSNSSPDQAVDQRTPYVGRSLGARTARRARLGSDHMETIDKSWFAIGGDLEPIDYDGPSHIRFPAALAEAVIGTYTVEGDWIFDPFCGFGTTLVMAQRLRRQAIGFEKDDDRARFATAR